MITVRDAIDAYIASRIAACPAGTAPDLDDIRFTVSDWVDDALAEAGLTDEDGNPIDPVTGLAVV